MTLQEVFDKSCRQIIAQGGPSAVIGLGIDRNEVKVLCRYRGPGGRQCVAGPFLSDEAAEIGDAAQLCFGAAQYDAHSLSPSEVDLIGQLQSAHDNSAREAGDVPLAKIDDAVFMERWRQRSRRVGKSNGLDVSVLDGAATGGTHGDD